MRTMSQMPNLRLGLSAEHISNPSVVRNMHHLHNNDLKRRSNQRIVAVSSAGLLPSRFHSIRYNNKNIYLSIHHKTSIQLEYIHTHNRTIICVDAARNVFFSNRRLTCDNVNVKCAPLLLGINVEINILCINLLLLGH